MTTYGERSRIADKRVSSLNPDVGEFEIYVMLAAWIVAPLILFTFHTRRGALGGFLVYSYIFSLIMSHWFGALVNLSPGGCYCVYSPPDTLAGFRLSSLALAAFAIGTIMVRPSQRLTIKRAVTPMERSQRQRGLAELDRIAIQFFFPLGGFCWALTFTSAGAIPSITSILSVGKECVLLAICLMCWSSWFQGDRRRFFRWMATALLFPVVTVISSGFIGYGIVMAVTVLTFVAMFFRPRWVLAVALVSVMYCGVTLWVNYAQIRGQVRHSIDLGESFEQRMEPILKMLQNMEAVDFSNPFRSIS